MDRPRHLAVLHAALRRGPVVAILGPRVPAQTLHRFWSMLAHTHGQVWSSSKFARSFGMSDVSVRRYLARQLAPWHQNLGKRLVKSPKVYVADSGLLHQLLGVGTREALLVARGARGPAAAAPRRDPRRGAHVSARPARARGGARSRFAGHPAAVIRRATLAAFPTKAGRTRPANSSRRLIPPQAA